MTEKYIEQALQELHISKRYAGRRQLAGALKLALEDENRTLKINAQLYAPVAEQLGGGPETIARNIRTIARRTWDLHPDALQKMAGRPLDGPPKASEMVEIIMTYILRTWPDAWSYSNSD